MTSKKMFAGDECNLQTSHSKSQENLPAVICESISLISDESCALKRDIALDTELYEELQTKKVDSEIYKDLLVKREQLPSFRIKAQILTLIEENQVVLISGEAGSGKTTQIPQFILDECIENNKGSICHIICTQPRRISAISVAERVAEERDETLGSSVGYHIRLEKIRPRERGSVVFCTTGIILRHMEVDPCLSEASHIILDEIHERDIMSDLLMAVLKQLIIKRSDLKIILMSATVNFKKFSEYFNDCKHINIPGKIYAVEELYLEDVLHLTKFNYSRSEYNYSKNITSKAQDVQSVEQYIRKLEKEQKYSNQVYEQLRHHSALKVNLDLILALLQYICEDDKDDMGAILVFLTGYAEISTLSELIEQSTKFPKERYIIFPLHSKVPSVEQKQIFERPPKGVRKIILSTNIAETSITIDDVVYVLDCGKVKVKHFNLGTNTQTLLSEWVSLASVNQRKGRAGRVHKGICFHLFPRCLKEIMNEYQKPEIMRSNLEDIILTIKVLQVGKMEPFFMSLMDPPGVAVVRASIDVLKRLNALDRDENLTPLGVNLSKLPMSPHMGKMIIFGIIFSCLDPVLSIVASLDYQDPFQVPFNAHKAAYPIKLKLSKGQKSDHLLYYEALSEFEKLDDDDAHCFCCDYFLNLNTLKCLGEIKIQFMTFLYDMNYVPDRNPKCASCNCNSENMSLVKAIVSAALYPNVIVARKARGELQTLEGEKVYFHPKSMLREVKAFESPLFVYHFKLKSTASFIHDATMIHPLALLFFGGSHELHVDGSTISMDNKLKFMYHDYSTVLIIRPLCDRLHSYLNKKMLDPGMTDWEKDEEGKKLLKDVMQLIAKEEKRPSGYLI